MSLARWGNQIGELRCSIGLTKAENSLHCNTWSFK